MAKRHWLERISGRVTAWTGSSSALVLAFSIILLWIITGPLFGFSDTWQLVINTGTTIVTFLMVFMIQRSQNKDSIATQLKLNELVAAIQGASNRLISIEDLGEDEIHRLHAHYRTLSKLAHEDKDMMCSHSIEEAEVRHHSKKKGHRASHPSATTCE